MKQRKWRVSADLPAATRDLLKRAYRPRFEQVHLSTITWAYGVEESFPFDSAVQDCVLTGHHLGFDHECFTLQLGGQEYRAGGQQRLFLAISTAAGVPPVEAGSIDLACWQPIEPVWFAAQLRLQPLFQRTPERNPAFAGAAA